MGDADSLEDHLHPTAARAETEDTRKAIGTGSRRTGYLSRALQAVRRPGPQAAILTVLVGAAQISSLFSEELQVPDHEELTNGSVALELLHGHFAQVFALQPRPYCGGCTVDSILLAPLYAVAGPSLFVFRLVPVFFYLAMLLAGFRLLRRYGGEAAGLAFGLLWLLPPYAWLRISFVSYGNHYESVLYPLIALNLAVPAVLAHRAGEPVGRGRYVALGAALGFGVYSCFTAVYAVPALLSLVAYGLRDRPASSWRTATLWTGLGGLLGAAPWALYRMATGVNPLTTSIYRDDDLTFGLQYIPHKLASLLAPAQLEAIFGYPGLLEGRVLAWATALSLLAAGLVLAAVRAGSGASGTSARGWATSGTAAGGGASGTVAGCGATSGTAAGGGATSGTAAGGGATSGTVAGSGATSGTAAGGGAPGVLEAAFGLLAASFLALYLGARYFNIEYPGDTWPSPVGLRYLSPLYAAGIPLLALAVQRLWERGRSGRILAALLLLAPVANGMTARAALLSQAPLSRTVFDALGADYPFFRSQGAWQIDDATHRRCPTDDPRSIAFHQWSNGWREGFDAWNGRVDGELSGLSEQARLELRIRRLAALKPPRADQARAYFQGVAWALQGALVRPGRRVDEVLLELAQACRGMAEVPWEVVSQEVQRAPDWIEAELSRASSVDVYVGEVVTPLETASALASAVGSTTGTGSGVGEGAIQHDLARAAAWGLGFAVGRRHLIIGRPPPDRLIDVLALAGRRLAGQWDEIDPLLRPLPAVPDSLPQRLRESYAAGFGEALGARWGTRFQDPPLPAGIPPTALEAYRSAYRRGESEYFLR